MPQRDQTLPVAAGVSLADFSEERMMVPRLRESATAGVIHELSQVISSAGIFPDVLPFYQRALNREFLTSSALPCGIAVPHARIASVRRLQFAVGRLQQPVSWCGQPSTAVQLVFLLAVPATDATTYLRILRGLSVLGSSKPLLAELLKANTPASMLESLKKIPVTQ